jgi:hypothetical protein
LTDTTIDEFSTNQIRNGDIVRIKDKAQNRQVVIQVKEDEMIDDIRHGHCYIDMIRSDELEMSLWEVCSIHNRDGKKVAVLDKFDEFGGKAGERAVVPLSILAVVKRTANDQGVV